MLAYDRFAYASATHVRVYVCMCVCMYICMCVCMCVCIHAPADEC